ncbi:hypothetical protein LUX33_51485 [Actinomadura madurae]|nr:hypothetical protein [Actinomadura madurae]MCP9955937.1 hypothetical protein [Actinomadura madurae]
MDDWPGSGLTDEELDVAYNVRRKAGPELFERHMARYREMSEQAVEGLPGRRGLVYDEASGERLDVWGVGDEPRPVFVFLHGGYWMALSRDVSSFMARTLYEQGIATVVPDYTLAPGGDPGGDRPAGAGVHRLGSPPRARARARPAADRGRGQFGGRAPDRHGDGRRLAGAARAARGRREGRHADQRAVRHPADHPRLRQRARPARPGTRGGAQPGAAAGALPVPGRRRGRRARRGRLPGAVAAVPPALGRRAT